MRRILTIIFTSITIGVFFSGCIFCEPKIVDKYIYVPEKVYVPVQCEVPDPGCQITEDMSRVDVVDEMYRCIKQYEENVKVCKDQ
jgi:hypothetical protein